MHACIASRQRLVAQHGDKLRTVHSTPCKHCGEAFGSKSKAAKHKSGPSTVTCSKSKLIERCGIPGDKLLRLSAARREIQQLGSTAVQSSVSWWFLGVRVQRICIVKQLNQLKSRAASRPSKPGSCSPLMRKPAVTTLKDLGWQQTG